MKRFIVLVILGVLFFSGCGSNSSKVSQRDIETKDPTGVWLGYQSIIKSGVFDMKTIIYDGKVYGISEDANIIYYGEYREDLGHIIFDGYEENNTTYKLYTLDRGEYFSSGAVSAYVGSDEITGVFSNSLGQEGEIKLYRTSLFDINASLEYIEGEYTTKTSSFSINKEGNIAGKHRECNIDGKVVPHASNNIYEIEYTLSQCSVENSFNGVGFVALDNNSSPYFLGITHSLEKMDVIGVELTAGNSLAKSAFNETQRSQRETISSRKCSDCFHSGKVYPTNYSFKGNDYGGADFSNVIAIDGNFRDTTFAYTQYSDRGEVEVIGANFDGSIVTQSTFIYADLSSSSFIKAQMQGVNLTATKLISTDFTGANLEGADFRGSDFGATKFHYAYLKNSQFSESVHDIVLSNAWWIDGSRCNVVSIFTCLPKIVDNHLTYEEYLQGKEDLDKDIETIVGTITPLVEEGKQVLKETFSVFTDLSGW